MRFAICCNDIRFPCSKLHNVQDLPHYIEYAAKAVGDGIYLLTKHTGCTYGFQTTLSFCCACFLFLNDAMHCPDSV